NEYTVNSKEEAFIFTQKNIEGVIDLAIKHQKLLIVFYEAIPLSKLVREKWEDISNKFIKRIAKNVEQAIAKGVARNPEYDPEIVAGVLFYVTENTIWNV